MIGKILHNRYRIDALLGEGGMSAVYRAADLSREGVPVAIKAIRKDRASSRVGDLIRFRNEALAASRLHHPCIIEIYDILSGSDGPLIVMEYIRGQSLASRLSTLREGTPGSGFSVDAACALLMRITDALAHVHAAGIIHRDLKPGNILTGPEDDDTRNPVLKIIDFGLAKVKDFNRIDEEPDGLLADSIMGTFAYMAPEQIQPGAGGGPDERSDLYSLGVIGYELLAGRNPFDGPTITTMAHQQLARMPEPPTQINPAMPAVLGAMVMKLLAKEPAARYQSARGLLHDLQRLAGGDSAFVPGQEDRTARISYRTEMIGRDQELTRLMERAAMLSRGTGGLCLISGEAGMGKTRLTEELKGLVFRDGISVISGNCFAGDNKTPYGPFADAMNLYLRRFGTYTESRRRDIKEQIKKTVGGLGEIILKLNPALIELIDEARPLVALDPEREKNRFLATLGDFFHRLAAAEEGLLIVLEDLQWADEGTLALISELTHSIEQSPLLIAGTCRLTELPPGHGLKKIMIAARENNLPLLRIELAPLVPEAMNGYLARILHKSARDDSIIALGELISGKSRGNPFFAREIIKQLIDGRAVYYDDDYALVIDRPVLASMEIPETIVDILLRRITLLETEEIDLLSHAAVIGKKFDMPFLLKIYADARRDDHAASMDEEDIVPIIDRAIGLHLIEEDPHDKSALVFAHDTIREMFYQHSGDDQRRALHRAVARALEQAWRDSIERDPAECPIIFDLAHHYRQAGDDEKSVRYALPAGRKAREKHAYDDALGHLSWALDHCGAVGPAAGETRIEISRLIGDIYVTIGKNDEAIALYKNLLPSVTGDQEKSIIFKQISRAYFNKGDWKRCERHARVGLRFLGERLPLGRMAVRWSVAVGLLAHAAHGLAPAIFVRSRPAPAPERHALIVWFYYALSWSYLMTDPLKFVRTIVRMLNIARRRIGPSRELGISMALYAALCSTVHLFGRSMRYNRAALQLREDLRDEWGIAQSYQLLGYAHYFNGDTLRACEYYERSAVLFRAIGDLKELGNSLSGKIWYYFLVADYPAVREAIDQYTAVARRSGDDFSLCYADYYEGVYWRNVGDYEQSRAHLEKAFTLSRDRELWGIHCYSNIELGCWCTDRDDLQQAIVYLEEARAISESYGLLRETTAFLYYSLADAYIIDYQRRIEAGPPPEPSALRIIRRATAQALARTRSSALIHGPSFRVAAKYQALIGNTERARDYFQRSIDLLTRVNHRAEIAKSLLEYGIFLSSVGETGEARDRFEASFNLYSEIGNRTHIKQLREILGIGDDISAPSVIQFYQRLREKRKVAAIIGLIRDLSADMPLGDLAGKALAMIAEITGAGRGYILLNDGESNLQSLVSFKANANDDDHYSSGIVRKAFESGEPVITTDAEFEQDFSAQQSVAYHALKSIMAVPVRHQGNTIGVCYLDNPFTSGVFTNADVETVQIIMNQVSIKAHIARNTESSAPALPDPDDGFYGRFGITPKEREVLALLMKGYTRKMISKSMNVSYETAKMHLKNIYAKAGVSTKDEIIELMNRSNS